MRNIWLVIKHEIGTTLRKRSFWIVTFLMPLVLLGFNLYYIIQENQQENEASAETTGSESEAEALPVIGFVDDAGIIKTIPEAVPADLFRRYPEQEAARAALEAGELDQYLYIPADYLESGDVTIYDKEFQIMESGDNMGVAFQSNLEWMLPYLINSNITGDPALVQILVNPTPGRLAEYNRVGPVEEQNQVQDMATATVVAQAIPYIYYFILIISSGYMLQSVTAEKENRTVEVLLLSLRPVELMAGKILGLTVVVLIQIGVWIGGSMLTVGKGARFLNLSQFDFPPGFAVWAVVFLVLGYLVYAGAMAAAGTIANNAREGNQITWILIIPLMPTLMFARLFLDEPHGTFSMILSMFPLSAPSAMVTRMAVSDVPVWQILTSLLGLALTALFMVWLSGRFFKPQNLLSQASFNWRRLATGWRSR